MRFDNGQDSTVTLTAILIASLSGAAPLAATRIDSRKQHLERPLSEHAFFDNLGERGGM